MKAAAPRDHWVDAGALLGIQPAHPRGDEIEEGAVLAAALMGRDPGTDPKTRVVIAEAKLRRAEQTIARLERSQANQAASLGEQVLLLLELVPAFE